MRIVIEHSKSKREIVGSFNICGSYADLSRMAKQIKDAIGKQESPNFTYGWVAITEPAPMIPNTEPKGWDE